jgi:Putative peptidoglycan binding domain
MKWNISLVPALLAFSVASAFGQITVKPMTIRRTGAPMQVKIPRMKLPANFQQKINSNRTFYNHGYPYGYKPYPPPVYRRSPAVGVGVGTGNYAGGVGVGTSPTVPLNRPNRYYTPYDPNGDRNDPRYDVRFSNNEIRRVQQELRRLGIYAGSIDGRLGADTQTAIERYQLKNKQPVTGLPDRWLRNDLGLID